MELYKSFPPGWEHLKIPTSSRRAALTGLSLYAACRRRAVWGQRIAWAGVALFGPRVLPGIARPWTPIGEDLWEEISRRWRSEVGSFDAVAGYQRTVSSRPGFAALLLRGGTPLAFVKLRPEAGGEHAANIEEQALQSMGASEPRSFDAPRLLAAGVVDPWRYFCTSTLPARLHRAPSSPPLAEITAEIRAGLSPLPRPAGTPGHWQGMHGDFTPWNLRQSGGRLFLVDWEHAGWGPPHADEIGYRLSASLIGVSTGAAAWSPPPDGLEAIRFWIEQATRWGGTRRDDRYVAVALRTLGEMEVQVSRISSHESTRPSPDASTPARDPGVARGVDDPSVSSPSSAAKGASG
jgi:hypothetical protein